MESAGVWYLGTGHYLSPGGGGGVWRGAEEFRGFSQEISREQRGDQP